MSSEASIHAIEVKANDGTTHSLKEWAGKVALVVNTASECGYTPQYAGLQQLYDRYRAKGFVVLAFPSNDFGAQEPGSDADIKKFCELRYKTTFPLFSKIQVKGDGKHPLYAQLTSTPGASGEVKWNFTKFLVDAQGKVVARFESKVEPTSAELAQKIESLLPR
ncbi:MAG: glutathione peroxidase [Myxococcaceae bacterium]